jgi:xylitol oxidase
MSPCYGRDSVGIHFTWKPQQAEVMGVLPHIEDALKPFGVRPHWGKLFTLSGATISEPYERLNDFCDLVRRYDPSGKFTNSFLNKMIFGQ